MSRNENFWVGQVTVPHPPLGNDKGWGTTRGGGYLPTALVVDFLTKTSGFKTKEQSKKKNKRTKTKPEHQKISCFAH